ncbi:hypothetical protein [Streptomyces sp. NPDC088794]|uniref:hypothetical protein n=1 Tax=Streptomyces sp. NPDC088794 TaxID=3365902 RepID=UPI003826E1A5
MSHPGLNDVEPAGSSPVPLPGPSVFWPPRAPQIGHRVFYRLSGTDVRAIARQRVAANTRAPHVRAGMVLPATVVRASGTVSDPCNLHVLLDGPDTYWAEKVVCGDSDGTWAWPAQPAGA